MNGFKEWSENFEINFYLEFEINLSVEWNGVLNEKLKLNVLKVEIIISVINEVKFRKSNLFKFEIFQLLKWTTLKYKWSKHYTIFEKWRMT